MIVQFLCFASEKNDENLVIVRGNQRLAQAYAVHIKGVCDHCSWRVFLANGGNPDLIYKNLDGWKPGGSPAMELDFWMNKAYPEARAVSCVTPSAVQLVRPKATRNLRMAAGENQEHGASILLIAA